MVKIVSDHDIARFLLLNSEAIAPLEFGDKALLIQYFFEYAYRYEKQHYAEFAYELLQESLSYWYAHKDQGLNDTQGVLGLGWAVLAFVEQGFFDAEGIEGVLEPFDGIAFKMANVIKDPCKKTDYEESIWTLMGYMLYRNHYGNLPRGKRSPEKVFSALLEGYDGFDYNGGLYDTVLWSALFCKAREMTDMREDFSIYDVPSPKTRHLIKKRMEKNRALYPKNSAALMELLFIPDVLQSTSSENKIIDQLRSAIHRSINNQFQSIYQKSEYATPSRFMVGIILLGLGHLNLARKKSEPFICLALKRHMSITNNSTTYV
jgi:hypothetical protein